MIELNDWLMVVRSARPAGALDSPWAPGAQNVMERALAAGEQRRVRRRRRTVALSVLAAACAVAAAVLVLSGEATQGPVLRHRFPPAFGASAVQVLDRAAFVALATGGSAPRPDQYVYSRREGTGGRIVQSWMSVDGTRASVVGSLTVAGCANGRLSLSGPGGERPCTPEPAYFPAMPTAPRRMLAYLERTQGVRLSNLNDLVKVVGSLLDTDYLLPAQQAALFRFLASTPGLTAVSRMTDAAGRSGVGIGWKFDGTRAALIFDPRTYTYLGIETQDIAGHLSGDARLANGIVDAPGQLPVGSAVAIDS